MTRCVCVGVVDDEWAYVTYTEFPLVLFCFSYTLEILMGSFSLYIREMHNKRHLLVKIK